MYIRRRDNRLWKGICQEIQGTAKGAEINKETTINDWVKLFKFEVCSTCKFYNKDFDICSGEMLPMERAIIKNLEGRGNCRDIKDFAKQLNVEIKIVKICIKY